MCAVLNRPGWFRSILGERGRTWPRCFFELDVVAAGLTFAAVIIETDIANLHRAKAKRPLDAICKPRGQPIATQQPLLLPDVLRVRYSRPSVSRPERSLDAIPSYPCCQIASMIAALSGKRQHSGSTFYQATLPCIGITFAPSLISSRKSAQRCIILALPSK